LEHRVLFVEDERRAVTPYFPDLQDQGVSCTLAQDGDEAITQLEKQPFDLIVLDIMFPAGDIMGDEVPHTRAGLGLLQLIRQGRITHCPADTPVIVLTAAPNYEIEMQFLQAKVDAYLKKPVDHQIVLDTILARLRHER
jgi:DNA-binding response OmpR family regulator